MMDLQKSSESLERKQEASMKMLAGRKESERSQILAHSLSRAKWISALDKASRRFDVLEG